MADINPAAFYGIAAVIVAAGLAAVGVKHIFHAALALIATFLGIAALYLLLNAEFLAGAQVLIYVGAIAVLILFAIMLTPDINTRAASHSPRQRVARGLAVFAFALLTGMLLLSQPWKQSLMVPGETDISALAGKLLCGYAFPFEILSLLLLAALIGALLIAKPEKES